MDTSIIGTDMGSTSMPVEWGKIREFAKAILDDNPVYEKPDAPIPLTFSMVNAHWPAPTGGQGSKFAEMGLDMLRILHAGQEFEYLKPIHGGDTLTSSTKISDVKEKEGRKGGTLTFITSETTWTNQRNEKVMLSRTILVHTSKAAS
ncbi:MAG: FAS1-like dehydratase domain-containing protein [Actinomycetota bacterium]